MGYHQIGKQQQKALKDAYPIQNPSQPLRPFRLDSSLTFNGEKNVKKNCRDQLHCLSEIKNKHQWCLSSSLPGEPLVQERKHLCHVELNVFKVEVLLTFFLHLEQIIQLEVELQQSPITT